MARNEKDKPVDVYSLSSDSQVKVGAARERLKRSETLLFHDKVHERMLVDVLRW